MGDILVGKKFNRFRVIKEVSKPLHLKTGGKYYLCKCKCGNTKILTKFIVNKGSAISCGCQQKEMLKERNTTHGLSATRLPLILRHIIDRCYNPENKRYKDYGGRGITVCKRWLGENRIQNFYEDMGARPKGKPWEIQIDRINNDKGYSKNNCRWTINKVNANNRRDNRYYEYKGVTKTITEWSEMYNINTKTLQQRLDRNWTMKQALTLPIYSRVIP